jgi:multidrug efflux pump subunit AcrA (membrane-fusion protein)
VVAGAVGGYLYYRRIRVEVRSSPGETEALVSASGKVQPKKLVNISADTIGRVTKLSVEEGDIVKKGQFLLQIDPENLESAVELTAAGLAAGREAVQSARVVVETARANLTSRAEPRKAHAPSPRRVDLAGSPRPAGRNEVRGRAQARETECGHRSRDSSRRWRAPSARHNLSKVTLDSPWTAS